MSEACKKDRGLWLVIEPSESAAQPIPAQGIGQARNGYLGASHRRTDRRDAVPPDPPFFPWFVIVTHGLNVFFMLMLARSGLEVLSSFPKLYWNDGCSPGREWLRLSKRTYGADSRRPWTSLDEEEAWNPVVAMPGRKNLGIGRHWHFLTIHFWVATGAVYVGLVFASGYWRYLVPTDWSIVPNAIEAAGTYLQFQLPPPLPGEPFNAAQKLAYFVVIFGLAPLQVASGAPCHRR